MKRLLILSLITLLCLPVAGYAASIGGAETQGQGKLALGWDAAFIFNRDLKFKDVTGLGPFTEIIAQEIDEGYQQTLKTSYGLLDHLDIYIKLGIADYKSEEEVNVLGRKYCTDENAARTGFAYGFGLKGKYELKNDWLVGCDLQYLRSKHTVRVNETCESWTGFPESSTTYKSLVVQEWHIAPYLAKRIKNLTPYFGIRYSSMKLNMKKPTDDWTEDHKYDVEDTTGLFLGTDYKLNKNICLNLEVRLMDETALSFTTTYKF